MEDFKLKETTTKEVYKIISGGVFAVDELRKTRREVDGNELIKSLFKERELLEETIEKIKKDLDSKKHELAENISLINDILTVYKKVPKRLANGLTETDENGEFIYTWIKRS